MGDDFDFDENHFPAFQEMVAEFQGVKSCPDINDARYRKFCTKNKVPEPQTSANKGRIASTLSAC